VLMSTQGKISFSVVLAEGLAAHSPIATHVSPTKLSSRFRFF
jgi:hypothetical protein